MLQNAARGRKGSGTWQNGLSGLCHQARMRIRPSGGYQSDQFWNVLWVETVTDFSRKVDLWKENVDDQSPVILSPFLGPRVWAFLGTPVSSSGRSGMLQNAARGRKGSGTWQNVLSGLCHQARMRIRPSGGYQSDLYSKVFLTGQKGIVTFLSGPFQISSFRCRGHFDSWPFSTCFGFLEVSRPSSWTAELAGDHAGRFC
jgi:hypothetical protein